MEKDLQNLNEDISRLYEVSLKRPNRWGDR